MKSNSSENNRTTNKKEFFEDQKRRVEFPTEVSYPTEHNAMLQHEKRQLTSD